MPFPKHTATTTHEITPDKLKNLKEYFYSTHIAFMQSTIDLEKSLTESAP